MVQLKKQITRDRMKGGEAHTQKRKKDRDTERDRERTENQECRVS